MRRAGAHQAVLCLGGIEQFDHFENCDQELGIAGVDSVALTGVSGLPGSLAWGSWRRRLQVEVSLVSGHVLVFSQGWPVWASAHISNQRDAHGNPPAAL